MADCDDATPVWLPETVAEGSVVVLLVEVLGWVEVLLDEPKLPDALPLAEPLRLPEAVVPEELGDVVVLCELLGV